VSITRTQAETVIANISSLIPAELQFNLWPLLRPSTGGSSIPFSTVLGPRTVRNGMENMPTQLWAQTRPY